MNVNVESDGRWVLGNPVGACPKCKAPAAVKYAANGKAEVWHAPTDCCDWARERERRFDGMRQREAERDERREEHMAGYR
jgi:hypothetical protein